MLTSSPAAGRVAARLARQVEVGLATVDLSLSQYRLLMFLADGSAPASDLARGMAVTPPSVTAVADGLVARGLIERRHEAGDRRRVGHVLTAEGQRVLAAADTAVDGRLAEIAGFLANEAEAAEALGGLARWRQALDRYRAAKAAGRA
ncbi:MAG TPA: MarR family transcriptional regulator [Acidimicrobiales bacterium]|nr:MarR family transcriptional regulator [Acidimicrobiales bacterium]